MLSDNVAKAVSTHVHVTDLGGYHVYWVLTTVHHLFFLHACAQIVLTCMYICVRVCACVMCVHARGTLIVASLLYFALKSDEFIDTIVLADAWINVHLL